MIGYAKHLTPGIAKQRLTIKRFATRDLMYKFLNSQDNSWQEYTGTLKAGIYAYAGGEWHNVKKLDTSVLAHI